jgi:hypothetical protein
MFPAPWRPKLRVPNLKIATVLLVAMFFFDIYWARRPEILVEID